MRFRLLTLAAASLLSSAACASVVQGKGQDIRVNSTPAGATVTIDGASMGTTPALIRVPRRKTHVLRLDLPGYAPYEMRLERKVSGWAWGNLIFGGVVGLAVDSYTGAMYRLTPGTIDANLQTRTATIDGRRAIEVAIVLSPDPAWERIGQLSRE